MYSQNSPRRWVLLQIGHSLFRENMSLWARIGRTGPMLQQVFPGQKLCDTKLRMGHPFVGYPHLQSPRPVCKIWLSKFVTNVGKYMYECNVSLYMRPWSATYSKRARDHHCWEPRTKHTFMRIWFGKANPSDDWAEGLFNLKNCQGYVQAAPWKISITLAGCPLAIDH